MALTEERIKDVSGQYDLEIVFELKLQRAGLVDVSVLSLCSHLSHVDLSGNEVLTLRGRCRRSTHVCPLDQITSSAW